MNAVTAGFSKSFKSNALRSSQDLEYDAFSYVTRLMRQAGNTGRSKELINAVSRNNELWTFIADMLIDPTNALSDETKAGLLSLAGFSIRHGHAVLAGNASTDVLIDINMSVMKGIRGGVGR